MKSAKAIDDCLRSTVLLRVALVQANALAEWGDIERGVWSALVTTESLRTLDRLRRRVNFSDIEVARRGATILALIDSLELVEIDGSVLDRAAQPMPTELSARDAIHLVSALLWRDAVGIDLVMATHDKTLAVAGQAHGLKVIGS